MHLHVVVFPRWFAAFLRLCPCQFPQTLSSRRGSREESLSSNARCQFLSDPVQSCQIMSAPVLTRSVDPVSKDLSSLSSIMQPGREEQSAFTSGFHFFNVRTSDPVVPFSSLFYLSFGLQTLPSPARSLDVPYWVS